MLATEPYHVVCFYNITVLYLLIRSTSFKAKENRDVLLNLSQA